MLTGTPCDAHVFDSPSLKVTGTAISAIRTPMIVIGSIQKFTPSRPCYELAPRAF
jgi:hypothetical protein